MASSSRLLDLAELVETYGSTVATWRRLVQRGQVPHLKLTPAKGSKVYVRARDIEAFLVQRQQAAELRR